MTETEAQEFLNDRGPWHIRVDSSQFDDPQFVFENESGDVLTVGMLVKQDYTGLLDEIEFFFNVGVKL